MLTLKIRNVVCGLLATALVMSGRIRRAERGLRAKPAMMVLCFHGPRAGLFERCVKWLKKRGYTFLSVTDVENVLYGRKAAPEKAVWITMDDALIPVWRDVAPIITKHHVPVVVFVPSGLVEQDGIMWSRAVRELQKELPPPYSQDVTLLWSIPESERRSVVDSLSRSDSWSKIARHCVAPEQLQELARIPEITLGAHTVNHVVCPRCSYDELAFELEQSRRAVQQCAGAEVRAFAYPFGTEDPRAPALLRDLGYTLAVNTRAEFAAVNSDPLSIPRLSMADDVWFNEALCGMFGIWQPFMQRLKAMLPRRLMLRANIWPGRTEEA